MINGSDHFIGQMHFYKTKPYLCTPDPIKKPNMVLKSIIFVTLIIAFLKIDVMSSQQVICINSTISLERGEPAVVSCEYALDFIAVFWYRGQAENPFLRLEGGRLTAESGFSIDSSGSMKIESVKIDHQGTYRILVVDVNGARTRATVNIYVKVSLKTDPQLESCSTSKHELCQEIKEEQKASFLICHTTETRPGIHFMWSKLSSSGPVDVVEIRSNSSINSSTGLFMSSSLFNYDKSTFSLQYFTCSATGQAVMDERNSTVFIRGIKDVPKPLKQDIIIFQGGPLQINCPEESFKLRKWTFTYPNNTVRILKELYPGEEGGSCLFVSNCYVNEKGVLSIETSTFENEGSYACTYSNGDTTGKTITKVSVRVIPNPKKIVIEGCKDIHDCNKNVALTGVLEVTITGARPYVELKCEIKEEAQSRGFIFDDKNSEIAHPESGTFDTVYTAGYEIDECSKPVPVICRIPQNSFLNNLTASHVNLVTDVSNCGKGKPGLVAFIVLVLIIIFAVVVLILYRRKREWVQNHLPECFLPESGSAPEEEMKNLEEKREDGEGANMANETRSVNESLQPLLPNELMSAFQTFCTELKETKRVPIKRFQLLIKKFQEHDQTTPPSSLLVKQMLEANCEHEMLLIVLKHLADQASKNWVPLLDFCKLLEEVTLSNKLSPGSSITIFVALLKDEKINMTTYVDETGKLLKSGKFDEITLMTNLKDLLSKELITQDELVHSILQYMELFELTKKTALDEVNDLENKVPYPLFLRGIHTFYKSGSCEEILFQFFDDIIKFSNSRSVTVIHQKVSEENEAISCVYLQALLCSILDGEMPLEQAINMLESGIKNKEILLSEYERAYQTSMKSKKITAELQRELSKTFLRLLKEVVSAAYFEEESLKMINVKQLDKMFWIRFIVELWKEGEVDEELQSKLILKVADTYLMLKDDFKKSLDEVIDYGDRKKFLSHIRFNDGRINIRQNKKQTLEQETIG